MNIKQSIITLFLAAVILFHPFDQLQVGVGLAGAQ